MIANDANVLIVDDLEDMRSVLKIILEKEGYRTITTDNGSTAVELVRKESVSVVVMDVKMPKMGGVEAMKRMKAINPDLPVILITAYGGIESAVEAVKLGAYDYITKPFDTDKVIVTTRNALSESLLRQEVKTLRSSFANSNSLSELMGSSDEIKKIFTQINQVSPTNFTVILYGETGSGKELVARAIHKQGLRRDGRFFAIDCGAIPETLIESELFGYERGAFTGAERMKEGCFELVSREKGTFFMDEIGNLPLPMQSKLLRVLEERSVRRICGKEDIEIDIRLIVASNEKLDDLARAGRFRQDIYHRLNEFIIEIPPLRKRKEDIIYLAKRFVDITNHELNKNVWGFSASALECLISYDWPGNVRELKNVVRRAVLLDTDGVIETVHLPIKNSGINVIPSNPSTLRHVKVEMGTECEISLKDIVKKGTGEIERHVIKDVLRQTGGNKSKAAKILKVDYKTMHNKVKEYGIKWMME